MISCWDVRQEPRCVSACAHMVFGGVGDGKGGRLRERHSVCENEETSRCFNETEGDADMGFAVKCTGGNCVV